MKYLITILLALSVSAHAKLDLINCNSYGPNENNLTVILDDDQMTGLAIGHAVMGNFFAFKIQGCEELILEEGNVYCDEDIVGRYEKITLALNDPGYNGPRANVELIEDKFLLSGSCRPADKNPLTIQF